MKMTLKEAHECLTRRPTKGCKGCKFDGTANPCFEWAMELGAMAIDYMRVGEKLIETNCKEDK